MTARCAHVWRPAGRGSKAEVCTLCRTRYPCAHACGHADCIIDRRLSQPFPLGLVWANAPHHTCRQSPCKVCGRTTEEVR